MVQCVIVITFRYGKTSAQILIRWSLQRGYICIPKSSNKKRIEENASVFDFEISEDDMKTMVNKMCKYDNICIIVLFLEWMES